MFNEHNESKYVEVNDNRLGKKLDLNLQVINFVNQNVTKSWKHASSYAFTLNNTMQIPKPNLAKNSLQLHENSRTNSLKSSFRSAGEISAISLRVSPFVWRFSVNKATSRLVFFTVFWFSCSSIINVSMEPSKEANLEVALHVGFRRRSETRKPRLSTSKFRRSRFWLSERRFFTSENSSFAFPIG